LSHFLPLVFSAFGASFLTSAFAGLAGVTGAGFSGTALA